MIAVARKSGTVKVSLGNSRASGAVLTSSQAVVAAGAVDR